MHIIRRWGLNSLNKNILYLIVCVCATVIRDFFCVRSFSVYCASQEQVPIIPLSLSLKPEKKHQYIPAEKTQQSLFLSFSLFECFVMPCTVNYFFFCFVTQKKIVHFSHPSRWPREGGKTCIFRLLLNFFSFKSCVPIHYKYINIFRVCFSNHSKTN